MVFNSVEPSSVAHTGYGHSSSDQLITNPRKMIAAGMIKLDNVHPGDPYYRLLIREYYLQKTKKTQCDSFGKLVALSHARKRRRCSRRTLRNCTTSSKHCQTALTRSIYSASKKPSKARIIWKESPQDYSITWIRITKATSPSPDSFIYSILS